MSGTEFTSSLPLWYQLAMTLRSDILAGTLPPGAQIDTELCLARKHGVSVMPVRRALRSLQAEGLIERHRGRGTFVTQSLRPLPGSTSLESLYSREFDVPPLVLDRSLVPVPPAFAASFPDVRDLILVRRLAFRHDRPWSYGLLYFLPEFDGEITIERLLALPLYRIMEEQCGVHLQRSRFEAQAVAASAEAAAQLQVDLFSPLLHLTAISHDQTGRAVGAFDMMFAGETHVFSFETRHDIVA